MGFNVMFRVLLAICVCLQASDRSYVSSVKVHKINNKNYKRTVQRVKYNASGRRNYAYGNKNEILITKSNIYNSSSNKGLAVDDRTHELYKKQYLLVDQHGNIGSQIKADSGLGEPLVTIDESADGEELKEIKTKPIVINELNLRDNSHDGSSSGSPGDVFSLSFKEGEAKDAETTQMIHSNAERGAYVPVLTNGMPRPIHIHQSPTVAEDPNKRMNPHSRYNLKDRQIPTMADRMPTMKQIQKLVRKLAFPTPRASYSKFDKSVKLNNGFNQLLEESNEEEKLKNSLESVPEGLQPRTSAAPTLSRKETTPSFETTELVLPVKQEFSPDQAIAPPEQLLDLLASKKITGPLSEDVLNSMSAYDPNKAYLEQYAMNQKTKFSPVSKFVKVASDVVPVRDVVVNTEKPTKTEPIDDTALTHDPYFLGTNQMMLDASKFKTVEDLDAIGPAIFPGKTFQYNAKPTKPVTAQDKQIADLTSDGQITFLHHTEADTHALMSQPPRVLGEYSQPQNGPILSNLIHEEASPIPHIIHQAVPVPVPYVVKIPVRVPVRVPVPIPIEAKVDEAGYAIKNRPPPPGPNSDGFMEEEESPKCKHNPCMNAGLCTAIVDGYICSCRSGFAGKNCERHSSCVPNPCKHGSCSQNVDGFVCTCKLGYKGKICDEINKCYPNPCQNGALCTENPKGVFCTCTTGFRGKFCEVEDKCSPVNPCLNGGTCQELDDSYMCLCQRGYRGRNCETYVSPTISPPTVPLKFPLPQAIPPPEAHQPTLFHQEEKLTDMNYKDPPIANPDKMMDFHTHFIFHNGHWESTDRYIPSDGDLPFAHEGHIVTSESLFNHLSEEEHKKAQSYNENTEGHLPGDSTMIIQGISPMVAVHHSSAFDPPGSHDLPTGSVLLGNVLTAKDNKDHETGKDTSEGKESHTTIDFDTLRQHVSDLKGDRSVGNKEEVSKIISNVIGPSSSSSNNNPTGISNAEIIELQNTIMDSNKEDLTGFSRSDILQAKPVRDTARKILSEASGNSSFSIEKNKEERSLSDQKTNKTNAQFAMKTNATEKIDFYDDDNHAIVSKPEHKADVRSELVGGHQIVPSLDAIHKFQALGPFVPTTAKIVQPQPIPVPTFIDAPRIIQEPKVLGRTVVFHAAESNKPKQKNTTAPLNGAKQNFLLQSSVLNTNLSSNMNERVNMTSQKRTDLKLTRHRGKFTRKHKCPEFCKLFCNPWCDKAKCCYSKTSKKQFKLPKSQKQLQNFLKKAIDTAGLKDQCPYCNENADCVQDKCVCKLGFTGDGFSCSIDPCLFCHIHADCQGGACICKKGYTGDGYDCQGPPYRLFVFRPKFKP